MNGPTGMDWDLVAKEVALPADAVQRTIELLDAGNTIPFVARFRRDQTGGLDEEQIRRAHAHVIRLRGLAERKQTILKSIESHGKLTPELAQQIQSANSPKRLEDLYLPYKPRKQTLAAVARERGLDPLADDVLTGKLPHEQLDEVVASLVRPEKGLHNAHDVLQGVAAIIAEGYGERADLRSRLRKIMHRSGKLVCTRVETNPSPVAAATAAPANTSALQAPTSATVEGAETAPAAGSNGGHQQAPTDSPSTISAEGSEANAVASDEAIAQTEAIQLASLEPAAVDTIPLEAVPLEAVPLEAVPLDAVPLDAVPLDAVPLEAVPPEASSPPESVASETSSPETTTTVASENSPPASPPADAAPRLVAKQQKAARKKKKQTQQEKKQKALENSFKDYFDHQEPIGQAPPHRVLAINRGERAKVLRVRVEADQAAMQQEAESLLVPAEHPHAEFLKACVRDALQRLVAPSLEREARRELTERAENHALEVFARNLRGLLLQPPVSGRRVLAIDPAYKNGCRLAAIDEFGNVLADGVMHLVGREDRRQQGRQNVVQLIKTHHLDVIAIGNGAASRETEQVITELLSKELADSDVSFVVVNEAGATIYSTSQIGREELPRFDPHVRSAISIGRRLLDPLSELVKINPANLGVGLYQHDVKSKHLEESLDAVVQSCVNFVGVEVNTASPALLSYVSGLNQLSARKLYEYRCQHGPFQSREQFKDVPGFGPATFVQSAGFLKITGGANPLDATSIHPESYPYAEEILKRLGLTPEQLAARTPPARRPPEPVQPLPSATTEHKSESPPEAPEAEAAESKGATEPASDAPTTDASTADPSTESTVVEGATEAATEVVTESVPADASQAAVANDSESEASADSAASALVPVTAAAETPAPPPVNEEEIERKIAAISLDALAAELGVGRLLLEDLIKALRRPGRDPREDLPSPVFRRGLKKLDELQPGMELLGTVLNVVDFGAFVDIGMSDSGLVHISRLADRYVRDPHEVVGVGDVLKVWVVEVDLGRRRVSLTAIPPGTEKAHDGGRRHGNRGHHVPPGQPGQQGEGQGGPRERGDGRSRGAPRDGQAADRPARQGAGGGVGGNRPANAERGESNRADNRHSGSRPQGVGQSSPSSSGQSGQSGGRGAQSGRGPGRPGSFGGQRGGPGGQRGGQGGQRNVRPVKPPKFQSVSTSHSKPKKIRPAKPITKAMEEGREPLRSFSDLVQFVEKKKPKHEPPPPPELTADAYAAEQQASNEQTQTLNAQSAEPASVENPSLETAKTSGGHQPDESV